MAGSASRRLLLLVAIGCGLISCPAARCALPDPDPIISLPPITLSRFRIMVVVGDPGSGRGARDRLRAVSADSLDGACDR